MKQILFHYFILFLPAFAFPASQDAPHLSGADLSILWVIPFIGILLSIAIFPLVAPHFWHKNFGKISLFWAVSLLIPLLINHNIGVSITLYEVLHVGLLEYIPVSYTHLTLPTTPYV